MKITFAGVGGAFCGQDQYQSNMIIQSGQREGKRLLFDCGTDARFSLGELGATNYNIGDWLDAVYISHLHADHAGGLEWLGFCSFFGGKKIKLFIADSLVNELWQLLHAGMHMHEDRQLTLSDYFDVTPVDKNFWWNGIKCDLVRTYHIFDGVKNMLVYGLFMTGHSEESGIAFNSPKKVYVTADSKFDRENSHYAEADVIFQDAETYAMPSRVHAHYTDLRTLSDEIKAKMWLYHYAPHSEFNSVEDGFQGFVQKGQQFVF